MFIYSHYGRRNAKGRLVRKSARILVDATDANSVRRFYRWMRRDGVSANIARVMIVRLLMAHAAQIDRL